MRTTTLSAAGCLIAIICTMSVPAPLPAQPTMLQFSAETAHTQAISSGHDGNPAWLVAHCTHLRIRKRTDPASL